MSIHDETRIKKCLKCGEKKPLSEFGKHEDSEDGHQSYCKACKNALGKRRQQKNVAAWLRHHMSTRITTQLGNACPSGLTRDIETHLGYTLQSLVHHLRQELQGREPGKSLRRALVEEGYHVDHIHPLSRFPVLVEAEEGVGGVVVDWQAFRKCWAMSNLRAIPAEENLAKGAKAPDE